MASIMAIFIAVLCTVEAPLALGQNPNPRADVSSYIAKGNNGVIRFLEKLKLLNSHSLQEPTNPAPLTVQISSEASLSSISDSKLDDIALQRTMAKPMTELLEQFTKFQKKMKSIGNSLTKRSVDQILPQLRQFSVDSVIVRGQGKENPGQRDQMQHKAPTQNPSLSPEAKGPAKNQLLSKVQLKSLSQETRSQSRDQLKQNKRTLQNNKQKEIVKWQIKLESRIPASEVQRQQIENNVQSRTGFQGKNQDQPKRIKASVTKIPFQEFKSELAKTQFVEPQLNQTQQPSSAGGTQLMTVFENQGPSPPNVVRPVPLSKTAASLTAARKKLSFLTSTTAWKTPDSLTEPTDLFRKQAETSQPFQRLVVSSSLLPLKDRLQQRKTTQNRISTKQQFSDMHQHQTASLIQLGHARLQTRNIVTNQIPDLFSLAQSPIHSMSSSVTSSQVKAEHSTPAQQKFELQIKDRFLLKEQHLLQQRQSQLHRREEKLRRQQAQDSHLKAEQVRELSLIEQQKKQLVNVPFREEQLRQKLGKKPAGATTGVAFESVLLNPPISKPSDRTILLQKSAGKPQTMNVVNVQFTKEIPLRVLLSPDKNSSHLLNV